MPDESSKPIPEMTPEEVYEIVVQVCEILRTRTGSLRESVAIVAASLATLMVFEGMPRGAAEEVARLLASAVPEAWDAVSGAEDSESRH